MRGKVNTLLYCSQIMAYLIGREKQKGSGAILESGYNINIHLIGN